MLGRSGYGRNGSSGVNARRSAVLLMGMLAVIVLVRFGVG
jgi:hypothetical protein